MTLDYAQEAFRSAPTNRTAADYIGALVSYEADGMIGDDTFFNGINEVQYWLLYGRQFNQPLTPQERAAAHGCYIGHDMDGWYVAVEAEFERDEQGPSVGFDGRPHFPTEKAAADALEAHGNVLKAD